jgi:hypothetical protein
VKNLYLPILVLLTLSFSGCIDRHPYKGCHEPIYLSYDKLRSNYPAIKEPREIAKAGKIYVYGDTLLVNEKNKGIHVIDNSNKQAPRNLHFIELPGNIDIAVKDGILYADSFTDLVIIDIHDLNDIKTVRRKNDMFPYDIYQTLSDEDKKKERCYPEKDRGVVIGYE